MVSYPSDWEEDKLSDIGTFTKGAPFSKADISVSGNPIILYGELYTTYKEVTYTIQNHTKRKANVQCYSMVGDVIIPTSGETAEEIATATCVMTPGVILAGDLNIYRTKKLDGRFLSYVINHIINKKFSEIAQGISIIHISAKEIGKISVSYPPLPEQRAIADTLSTFDTHIKNLSELIEKKKAIRDGALDDLMSGRTRLKGFSGDWEIKTLGETLKVRRGKRVVRRQLAERGNFPVYQNSLTPLGFFEHSNCQAHSAFIIAAGNAGDVGFSDIAFWAADDCYYFEESENVDQKFLHYILLHHQKYIYTQTRRTSIPRLSYDILERIPITIPQLNEQQAIADTITALDNEINALETERDKIIQVRDGAMNDLLTGKVRLIHGN